MNPVSGLLGKRENVIYKVAPDATVFDGLKLLADYGIGAMLVMDQERLVGIFSERDYTRKVALKGKNSRETKVADIMVADVITVGPGTRTRACMELMSKNKIRHLPVVENGTVIGMISIRDIMNDIIADNEQTIAQLQTYISS